MALSIKEHGRVLASIWEEFQSNRKSLEELYLLPPAELDEYGSWLDDINDRLSALSNDARGKNLA